MSAARRKAAPVGPAITVIGTGTGAALSPQAYEALAGAELVVGARRHLEAAELPPHVSRVVLGPLAPALDLIEERFSPPAEPPGTVPGEREACGGAGDAHDEASAPRVVVLASGDPGFFGIVRALAGRFGAGALEVHPTAPSVAVAFARAGLPWDDAVVVSAHGRDLRTAVHVCRAHPKAAVLTGPGAGPGELGAALVQAGAERTLVVASALGVPGEESVERLSPADAAARDWPGAVGVVLCLDESRALSP
ncbi:precorrin-6y C5,15-methyltransferase (decarboxylating) subunit CbiE, partial [Streptomyces sp. 8N706]|uniref:precorrin-6y C5,15-methyltransferase (decarboxylating) subunit CbiE n=1 Tax=Streptomyces sp. 8N706 TaxID=3457416 RepID=UPI003FD2EFF7